MCVSRSKFLAVFLICLVPVLGWVLAPQVGASIIVPGSITEVNPSGYDTYVEWDASRDIGDKYWNDRNETIGQQGNITDAMTGKTMLGLEGLLLNNNAKGTQGNGPGDDYELTFQIDPSLGAKARVYVMIGIRDVFAADPDDWLEGYLNDDSYSPQMNVDRNHGDRTWIGLDAYGVPIASATEFTRVLRRPAPDGRPMALPYRNGVGEEYFAFYHDYDPGETVHVYGCYSSGSDYCIFAEMAPPPPSNIWTAADIGDTKTGDTVYNADAATWDIYAAGADIWGSADAFRYVYTENSGDFLIQGRINAVLNTNDWAKVGLMVRQSADPGSPQLSIAARGLNDWFGIQYRAGQGAGSGGFADNWVATPLPRWFRLQRAGNTFTASWSDDAVTWNGIGSGDMAMTDPVLVGMSVTSHDGNRITAAQYSYVYVTNKGQVFAHAGFDQSVDQGAPDANFILDGSNSLDAGEYLWEQISPATPTFSTVSSEWLVDLQTRVADAQAALADAQAELAAAEAALPDVEADLVFATLLHDYGAIDDETLAAFQAAYDDAVARRDAALDSIAACQAALAQAQADLAAYTPNIDWTAPVIKLDAKDVDIFGDTTFTFRLTVKNTASGATQTNSIHVFVKDKEQASAGADLDLWDWEGDRVDLNGTATTGTITKWAWEQVGGPDVGPFMGIDTAAPYFWASDYVGDQVFQFKVTINDGEGVDYVNVTIHDEQQVIANAGADRDEYEMRTLHLDARGSTTRDGASPDDLTYEWTQTGGPAVFGDYVAPGTGALIPGQYWFVAREIPSAMQDRRNWPPTRNLTFKVKTTGPNGSVAEDSVTITIHDAEFENVFYREHEDFDFHNSLVNDKWYPEEAEFGVHYCWGAVGNEVYGVAGRVQTDADYWWNGSGGWLDYRPGSSLGDSGQVRDTSGTDWKCGWINPGVGDYWKYTFELPTGSDKAYIVNWLATDNSWHGNSSAYYDYEQGNTSPVGYFRICRRGWDNYAPVIGPTFAVQPGLHKIMLDAYGGGEPNYARFELHVPMSGADIADAGPDKGAASGDVVTLDGRGSQVTGTTYFWEQLSPDTPAVTLADAGAGVATFTAPAVTDPTDFIFRLAVMGAHNDSVDFVHVMVVPAGEIFSVFADQRIKRDTSITDWGNRDVGGAEWGSDYQAGNWGAIAPGPTLSSDVVVHHQLDGDGEINNDSYSEYTFDLPSGSAGDYYLYLRAAYQNGDSAYILFNPAVPGFWPTDTPENDHHSIANNNGERGEMDWCWAKVDADTVTLNDGYNEVRIYGRESHCNEGRPFMWDAMVFSKAALDRGNFEMMDRIALAGRVAVTLQANAGDDFTVYSGNTGVLDGTGSLGADSYLWSQTAGPAVTITNAAQAIATFEAPAIAAPITLTFELQVVSGADSAVDTVDVTVVTPGAVPAMPTNLVAEPVEMGVKLTWDPVPGAETYKILRRESWMWWPFDFIVAENLSATSFIDTTTSLYMELYDYTVVAVNSFGDSIPAYPVYKTYALSANLALRADAGPFAKKPHPGWDLGLVMNNRVRAETFDSWYYSEPSADDWWGYTWSQPLYFQEIHYYPGNVFGDGGWWTSLGVQVTKDGQFWYDIPNVTITPAYDFTDSPDGRSPGTSQLPYIRRHVLKFPRVEGIGLRIYGAPGGSVDFTSMGELEVYGAPGDEEGLYAFAGADFAADEGTTATLDGTNSSTPLAVKYHWEQITGVGGQLTHVDMTSAYNADVIYAEGEVLADHDAFEPGGDNWLYSSNASIAPAGTNPLPADGKAGAYQLGPYTDKNCLLLSDQQRSGVVPVTPGNYGYLGVAFSGASGNHWVGLILNYADGGSPAIPFEFSDWFFRGDVERAWQNTFRVCRNDEHTGYGSGDPGGPNIYQRVLPVDSSRTLLSVTFTGFPGSGNQTGGVFAMNLGPPVPVLSLVNPDTAVCTFDVPEITKDVVVTFRLTVWDADNNSATDDVDVTLADTEEGRSDAGPDGIDVLPFRTVILDGSGTGGDIIWYRWEQIGGPPAVTLWNANQAQAAIIAPASGAMTFRLTVGASNGTVSADTMVVTVAGKLNPVPASGFLTDVLHLGANYTSRFNETDWNHDYLDQVGGEANQNPSAGDTVSTTYNQTEDPLVWTRMHQDDGYWFHDMADNYMGYLHVYILSPAEREARCWFWHDDEVRCFNNGAVGFERGGWDGGAEQNQDFTLYEGVNSMTFKLHEGGGGDRLTIRFTDRSNNQYADLQYVLSYSDLFPPAVIKPDPPNGLMIGEGELLYLDGRGSASGTYSWEQVWPLEPEFAWWYDDTNLPILGAPQVDEDTVFYLRLWVDTGAEVDADVVKVTVATKEIPGPVVGVTGEWAGDTGAVLRWSPAAHASFYYIRRADNVVGPYRVVGTADTNMFVDPGPLDPDGTYYYQIEPANILNVGTGVGEAVISRDPNLGNVSLSELAVPIVGQPAPLGGGSRDIGLVKDGIVAGQNYDTYDGNTPNPGTLPGEETFEFFGYLFDRPVEIHSLTYYIGGIFGDGGWWTTLGVQTTKDGVTWQDASGVVCGPVYDTSDTSAGKSWYEKFILSIIPDTVVGVRVAGTAGGSAHFVSIAELGAYGDIGGLNVNAGADMTSAEGLPVTLDGGATTGATQFLWEQVSGRTAVIVGPDQQLASFTAPGAAWTDTATFRLTASNAEWSAWDEVTFTITDVNSYHFYRYAADFDGRSTSGALVFPDGGWATGMIAHDMAEYMRDKPANEASAEGSVAGNDFFFQDATQSQTYRDPLLHHVIGAIDLGAGEEPYIGYTTAGDWWNYTFGSTKQFDARFPVDGAMCISVLASTDAGDTVVEVLVDEVVETTINFSGSDAYDLQWRPGADTFMVASGRHNIRLHVIQGSWYFVKFRLDLSEPAIESISTSDGMVTLIWSDVSATYTLQGAATPGGPWADVYGPTSETSLTAPLPVGKAGFYRIKVQ